MTQGEDITSLRLGLKKHTHTHFFLISYYLQFVIYNCPQTRQLNFFSEAQSFQICRESLVQQFFLLLNVPHLLSYKLEI